MWMWLLIGWGVVATAVSFRLGAVAATARRRERAARAHQYADEAGRERAAG